MNKKLLELLEELSIEELYEVKDEIYRLIHIKSLSIEDNE